MNWKKLLVYGAIIVVILAVILFLTWESKNKVVIHEEIIEEDTTLTFSQEIHNFINPEMDSSMVIDIKEIIAGFATVGYSNHVALLKRTEDGWIKIDGTQDEFECQIVLEYEVPASLVRNRCIFYKTTREMWFYSEEMDEWGKDFPNPDRG
jgi:hypothetical protein